MRQFKTCVSGNLGQLIYKTTSATFAAVLCSRIRSVMVVCCAITDSLRSVVTGVSIVGFQMQERGHWKGQNLMIDFSEERPPIINPEEPCESNTRVMLWARSEESGMILIYRPGCGTWKCSGCRKRLQRYWTLRISTHVAGQIDKGEHWQFVTLTSHEKLKTMEATVAVWPNAWNKIHARLKRNVGKKVQYVLIPEFHQDGRMHAHMLCETHIKKRWWKDNARASGLGYQVEVRDVNGKGLQASWYVSKYLGKDMDVGNWPAGFRHVRTSQGWPDLPDHEMQSELDFAVVAKKSDQWFHLRHWALNKFTVYDLTDGQYLYHEGELVQSKTIW